MSRIAIVTIRFGKDIVGGSERFAFNMAEALVEAGHSVHVLTTTADDYYTWKPHFPEGLERVNENLQIYRYNVDRGRWPHCNHDKAFEHYGVYAPSPFVADVQRQDDGIVYLDQLKNSPLQNSVAFIEDQGPFPGKLFNVLLTTHNKYHKILFIPYLYPTSLVGSRMVPADKAVIMLAAHNETMIHYPAMREYRRYRWGVFYEKEKEMFAEATGGGPEMGHSIVIPCPEVHKAMRPNSKYRNSLVFVGRASGGKCVDRLIMQLEQIRSKLPEPLDQIELELVGTVEDHIKPLLEERKWIKTHGNVTVEQRDSIVASCMALISPSLLDSMGLVNLEAAFVGTPVIANIMCPAFQEFVTLSGGTALGYNSYDSQSLVNALTAISTKEVRMQVANQIYEWATRVYTKENFIASLNELLDL